MSKISVIVEEETKSEGHLGGGKKESKIGPKEIKADVLKENMSKLYGQVSEIMKDMKSVGDFKLQQVQLAVEISAEGGVSLIGTAKAGAKGAITLTFGCK